MNVWAKFKIWLASLSLIAVLGAIATAAYMVLNARRAGMMEAEVEHGEARIKELNKGSEVDIANAAKLQKIITNRKVQARAVRKRAEAAQERIGQDETMADIAKRFNGKRVRSRKASTS